jgi:hypothetical protein
MKTQITINTNEVQILDHFDEPKRLVEGGIRNDEIIVAIRGEAAKQIVDAFGYGWPFA